MSKKFERVTTELLEGIVDIIIVHPSHDYSRDEVKKQLGHRMIINFKQSIVKDSIEYHTDNKSDGCNAINGKKIIKLKPHTIPKGGLSKTSKEKPSDLNSEQTCRRKTNPSGWNKIYVPV